MKYYVLSFEQLTNVLLSADVQKVGTADTLVPDKPHLGRVHVAQLGLGKEVTISIPPSIIMFYFIKL
jgi:hypothetical protein